MAPKNATPFAAIVRAAMTEHLPAYKLEQTTGGTGPIVYYRAPSKDRRITQSLHLQKGLYSPWIRANIATSFVDKRGGAHHIAQISLPDFTYRSANALETHLASLLPRVEKARAKEHAKVTKLAPQLAAMLDDPKKHVAAWMKVEGSTLPAEDFDPDAFARDAFDRFTAWMRSKKLLVSAGQQGLWHWWTDNHPKPRTALAKLKPAKIALRHPKSGARLTIFIKKDEVSVKRTVRGEDKWSVQYFSSRKTAAAEGAKALREAKKQGFVESPA